jgi:hypothetical protein
MVKYLFYLIVVFVKYTITKRWHPLFLACVILIRANIEFVRWQKCYRSLVEIAEKHLVKFRFGCLSLVEIELLDAFSVVILFQKVVNFLLFYFLQYLDARQVVYSEVEVAQEKHLCVVFNAHSSVF